MLAKAQAQASYRLLSSARQLKSYCAPSFSTRTMSSTALPSQQRVWTVAKVPNGPLEADTFSLTTRPLAAIDAGQVLVKVEYISNDPVMRTAMRAQGMPVPSTGMGRVLATKSDKYKEGELVVCSTGWADYVVVPDTGIRNRARELPGMPAASLGILGATTLTAYQGIFEVLKPKAGDTLVVSGAAGAVGSMAVQFGKKVCGARVIGIAGGKAKCDWVKSRGADDCIDYKDPDFAANLAAALPNKANLMYDNVGGNVLDAMLPLMAPHGVVAVCGLIDSYNGKPTQLKNLLSLISQGLTIQGFSSFEYMSNGPKVYEQVAQWIEQGKIDVSDGETVITAPLQEQPQVFNRLFTGKARGKLLTKLED